MSIVFKNAAIQPALRAVVDSLRTELSYSVVSYTGEYSTIEVANELTNNEVITINSVDYSVIEATATTVKVKGDVSGSTSLKTKAPYFIAAHIKEIANRLLEKNQGIYAFQKYPLILLPLDVTSDYDRTFNSFNYRDLTVYIVNRTQPEYYSEDRELNSFDAVLIPLYEQFITALKNSSLVQYREAGFVLHTKTDRYFWGSGMNEKNTSNKFGDYLDSIEISKLNISIKNLNC